MYCISPKKRVATGLKSGETANQKTPGLPRCGTNIQEIANTLFNALDAKESSIKEHYSQAADMAAIIAYNLGLEQRQVDMIHIAARLHDIRKIGIPDKILKKPGALTQKEWTVIKQHPVIGANIVSPIPFFNKKNGVRDIILHHHERYDGKGYPSGLKGESIPIGARLVTLSDAFSAMLEDRVYKERMTFDQAVEEIFVCSKTQFCPYLVNIFSKKLDIIEEYFQGKKDLAAEYVSFHY